MKHYNLSDFATTISSFSLYKDYVMILSPTFSFGFTQWFTLNGMSSADSNQQLVCAIKRTEYTKYACNIVFQVLPMSKKFGVVEDHTFDSVFMKLNTIGCQVGFENRDIRVITDSPNVVEMYNKPQQTSAKDIVDDAMQLDMVAVFDDGHEEKLDRTVIEKFLTARTIGLKRGNDYMPLHKSDYSPHLSKEIAELLAEKKKNASK